MTDPRLRARGPTHSRFAPDVLLPSLVLFLLASPPGTPSLGAQEKPALDHEDTYEWNRIEEPVLSDDGRWVAYVLAPYEGDGTLVVRALDEEVELRIERGDDPRFSPATPHLVFRIRPRQELLDSLRNEGKRGDDLPSDTLGVLDLDAWLAGGDVEATLERIDRLRDYALAEEEGAALAVHRRPLPDDAAETDEEEGGPSEAEAGDEDEAGEDGDEPEASPLELRILGTEERWSFENATEFRLSGDGSLLLFAYAEGDAAGVRAFRPEEATPRTLAAGEGRYLQLATDDDGRRAAFLTDRDDREADEPSFSLYYAGPDDGEATRRVAPGAPGLPDGWAPGRHGDLAFSPSGERLYFGSAPLPDPAPSYEDTVPAHEQVEVDVWNWRDDYLQPMQLLQAEDERSRTYRAVLHLTDDRVVQLADEEVPELELALEGDAPAALGRTDLPYRQLLSWDGRYQDLWAVDVETGVRRRVAEKVRGFSPGSLSPEGGWIHWWDGTERAWFAAPTSGEGEAVRLTTAVPHPVHDRTDDRPEPPGPYGSAGWTEGEEGVLLYDEYDIWLVDPDDPSDARNVTEGRGRSEGLAFRYVSTDPDREAVPLDEDVLLTAFHRRTKASGFYRDRFDGSREPERLVYGDHRFAFEAKADDADRYLVTRESFREFPDLRITDGPFADLEKISRANPRQDEFRWGSAELVEWTSATGKPLQGILYTPDGFDPSRTYPMMVYFYERLSDTMHRYRPPTPGGSSIAIPFYVSRGYLVFVPDIPYEVPYPGRSAVRAVVPGVLSLVERGFVNREQIGVQGHSWGGYQIAHMITRTNLFAAAEAGAPVVNMTSAYGGIRWGSGMSRMFQYERTQSRIGGSLWEATKEYLDNSPLFYVPQIETPVLFMHNDDDGAVPWYQGIEFFVALRRLGKPAWMLNYNGEKHGVRERKNQKDWAVRMQQFFDHYLKGSSVPVWMAEGVPATEKGRTLGLELLGGSAAAETESSGDRGGEEGLPRDGVQRR